MGEPSPVRSQPRHPFLPWAKVPLFSHFYLIEFSHHLAGLLIDKSLPHTFLTVCILGRTAEVKGEEEDLRCPLQPGSSTSGAGEVLRMVWENRTADYVTWFLPLKQPPTTTRRKEDVAEMREEGTCGGNREGVWDRLATVWRCDGSCRLDIGAWVSCFRTLGCFLSPSWTWNGALFALSTYSTLFLCKWSDFLFVPLNSVQWALIEHLFCSLIVNSYWELFAWHHAMHSLSLSLIEEKKHGSR